jgi:predicted alpha/beta hydrolase
MSRAIDIEGGHGSAGWLLPAADPAAPLALLVPALGVAARSYRRFGDALQARGISIACADLRGVGSSPLRAARGVDWGYLDLVDAELDALYRAARRQLPEAPAAWLGHSLGGQLALLHQARHRERQPAAVVLLASASPWTRGYPWWTRPLVAGLGRTAGLMARRLGVFRGDWLGFGGRQGARLMGEWSRFVAHGRLGRLEGWDADAALAGLELPLLAVSMRGDRYAPRAAIGELAALTRSRLQLERIDSVDGHVPGHFGWLRHPDAVAARLADRLPMMIAPAGGAVPTRADGDADAQRDG